MTATAFSLSTLETYELAEIGARLRRVNEGQHLGTDATAQRIVALLADTFHDSDGVRELALTRGYRTCRFARLSTDAARIAAASGTDVTQSTRCLVLSATVGMEPAWNHVEQSHSHRVIPLLSAAAIRAMPMVSRLLSDFGIRLEQLLSEKSELDSARPPGLFYVDSAVGSPHIPAQREFVLRYGIRSVVGFGGTMPDGEVFAFIMFARVPVSFEIASACKLLAVQASVALANATDIAAPDEVIQRARAEGLAELLRVQEYQYLRNAAALARDRDTLAERTRTLESVRMRELQENAVKQQRAQRAMLNVIEDLRHARVELERRVAERTAQLATANADLRSKNAELEQFAYIASHDLQEPLRTISGYMQLLKERYADRLDAEAHEFIGYAVSGALRQQELIEALLLYSRVKEVELRPVELDRVLDDVVRAISRMIAEAAARIERRPLPSVLGDFIQLRQLLQNLISNSIKFCGAEPPHIEVWAESSEDRVELNVRDHGIGFDPKHSEQVFRVFRRLQRKYPGTGIGLAICKRIAERHGGGIRATAEPGRGATFTVTLQGVKVS